MIRLARFSTSRQLPKLSAEQQVLNMSLNQVDPEIFDIIEREKQRQRVSIDLIPSEVRLNCPWSLTHRPKEFHESGGHASSGLNHAEQVLGGIPESPLLWVSTGRKKWLCFTVLFIEATNLLTWLRAYAKSVL